MVGCEKFYINRLYLIIEILVLLPLPYLAWNGINSNTLERLFSILILLNSSFNFSIISALESLVLKFIMIEYFFVHFGPSVKKLFKEIISLLLQKDFR